MPATCCRICHDSTSINTASEELIHTRSCNRNKSDIPPKMSGSTVAAADPLIKQTRSEITGSPLGFSQGEMMAPSTASYSQDDTPPPSYGTIMQQSTQLVDHEDIPNNRDVEAAYPRQRHCQHCCRHQVHSPQSTAKLMDKPGNPLGVVVFLMFIIVIVVLWVLNSTGFHKHQRGVGRWGETLQ